MNKFWKIVTSVLNIGGKVAEKLPNPIISGVGQVVDELIPDQEKEIKKKKSNKKQK
jgi:hypothetical protein